MENKGAGSKEYRLIPVDKTEEAGKTEPRVRRSSELVASLVRAAAEGDVGAFERLVFLYGNVAETAFKKAAEKAQFPEDVYQEAMTAVVKTIRNYVQRDNLREKSPGEISAPLISAVHGEVNQVIEKYSSISFRVLSNAAK